MVPNNSDDLQLCKSVPKRQQIILWEATVDALIERRRRAASPRLYCEGNSTVAAIKNLELLHTGVDTRPDGCW